MLSHWNLVVLHFCFQFHNLFILFTISYKTLLPAKIRNITCWLWKGLNDSTQAQLLCKFASYQQPVKVFFQLCWWIGTYMLSASSKTLVSNTRMEISQLWKKTTASLSRSLSYLLKDDLVIKKDHVSFLHPSYSGKQERKWVVWKAVETPCCILKLRTRITLKAYTKAVFLSGFLKTKYFPLLLLPALKEKTMNLLKT